MIIIDVIVKLKLIINYLNILHRIKRIKFSLIKKN
jgi:hypothetical protein